MRKTLAADVSEMELSAVHVDPGPERSTELTQTLAALLASRKAAPASRPGSAQSEFEANVPRRQRPLGRAHSTGLSRSNTISEKLVESPLTEPRHD